MLDKIEFRHLRYIVAIAETGNFTRAANRLFVTQPTLSKQIKDLENDIGFPIFLRNPRSVVVTPAGQLIVSYAQEALEQRAEAIRAALAFRQ